MYRDIEKVLFSEEELKKKVAELGGTLARKYDGKFPLLVGVLKGSFVFMADIVRALDIKCEVDFMVVSSYGNDTKTSGSVKIAKDLSRSIEGRHVIIIEDVLDSGVTLFNLKKLLEIRDPASIEICTLLDKPARRTADIKADYIGFTCPDEFVVGYGLDYAEKYRNLPYIGVLKRDIYS